MKRLSHLRFLRPKSEALPVIDCTAFSAAYPLGSCFFCDVSASCKKLQHAYNHHIAVSIRNLSAISRTLLWNIQLLHINALQCKQFDLHIDSSCLASQAAICANHAMTGDDNGYRVVANSTANCLRRHPWLLHDNCHFPCNVPIGDHLSVWNLT